MSLYQTLLGHPFVYDRVRPFIIGGIDNSEAYRTLAAGPDDVVLDIGCGTGDALNYLGEVRAYHGFDTDAVAIEAARKRAAGRGDRFTFQCRNVDEQAVREIAPTRVMLCGLLHHLPDDDALGLLGLLGRVPSVRRVATSDVVYLRGELVSNVFARLDRGKFVRTPPGYRSLIERAGLNVASESIVRSDAKKGRARYLVFGLEPRRP